jgi:hypothetical protein
MKAVLASIRQLASIAVQEAVARIKDRSVSEPPTFYCQELDSFTGDDGLQYVVEITVRLKED